MTTPHPADGYRNQTIRLADLTVLGPVIQDVTFENCQIFGPAVLFMVDTTLAYTTVDTPNLDMVLWLMPDNRQAFIGAVVTERVTFSSCVFHGVGFAVHESHADEFAQGFLGG